MKKIIIFIGLLTMLSSCVTQKACNKKYPPEVITEIAEKIIIRDSIVEKIINVPVYIKGDTINNYDTVVLNKYTGLINSKPVYAETEFSKAEAQVINSRLSLELIQKDTLFSVQAIAKEAYYWREKYREELTKTVKEVRYIPNFYHVMGIIGVISSVLFLVWLIFKLFKKPKLFL